MVRISIPYGNSKLIIKVLRNWKVDRRISFRSKSSLEREDIEKNISNPIGVKNIGSLVKNKKKICILIDDFTRKTPTKNIVDIVINKIRSAGIPDSNIYIVGATGMHRKMLRYDFEKKLSKKILNSKINVISHDFKSNLIFIGKSRYGTPIWLNKEVYNSDLKIAIGSIIPHGATCYGGGAKILSIGVTGYETVSYNHTELKDIDKQTEEYDEPRETTIVREDIEDIADKIGLDFIINTVLDQDSKIIDIFCGDRCKAFLKGIVFAGKYYKTKVFPEYDLVIAGCYPLEQDLFISFKGLVTAVKTVGKNGVLLCSAKCFEGIGYHHLVLKNEKYRNNLNNIIDNFIKDGKTLIFYSDVLKESEFFSVVKNNKVYFRNNIDSCMDIVYKKIYKKIPKLLVLESSPLLKIKDIA